MTNTITARRPSRLPAQRTHTMSILLLMLGVIVSCGISLCLGSFPTPPTQVLHALTSPHRSDIAFIIWELRLPRIMLAIAVGAALAVAGAILQGIVRNPLASPDVIGITSGASLAAVVFLVMLQQTLSVNWLPVAALSGGAISALLIFGLAWKKSISPYRLVLIGIGVAASASALTTLLIVIGDETAAMTAYVWLTGSLYAAQWKDVGGMLPWLMAALPISLAFARHADAMALGESVATGLGVAVLPSRIVLLACSVALAGAAVAFAGALTFIGLIAPHLGAKLVGRSTAKLIPTSALIGALIVLYADLLGRVAFLPKDLPAGIFVAGIGAPFFVYLLYKTRQTR